MSTNSKRANGQDVILSKNQLKYIIIWHLYFFNIKQILHQYWYKIQILVLCTFNKVKILILIINKWAF